jgi:hypothetical protein
MFICYSFISYTQQAICKRFSGKFSALRSSHQSGHYTRAVKVKTSYIIRMEISPFTVTCYVWFIIELKHTFVIRYTNGDVLYQDKHCTFRIVTAAVQLRSVFYPPLYTLWYKAPCVLVHCMAQSIDCQLALTLTKMEHILQILFFRLVKNCRGRNYYSCYSVHCNW